MYHSRSPKYGTTQARFRCTIVQWKNKGSFDIFNDISDHVTLVQLIDTAGNDNRAVSITGYWIYDYNYKRALPLMIESLDIIFSFFKDEKGIYAEFKDVIYAVGCENPLAKSAKRHLVNKLFLVL